MLGLIRSFVVVHSSLYFANTAHVECSSWNKCTDFKALS